MRTRQPSSSNQPASIPCARASRSTSAATSWSSGVPSSASIAPSAARNVSAPLKAISGAGEPERFDDRLERPRAAAGGEQHVQAGGAGARHGGDVRGGEAVLRVEQRAVDVEHDAGDRAQLVCFGPALVLTDHVVVWKMAQT